MIKVKLIQDLKKLEELKGKIPQVRERYTRTKAQEVVFEMKYRLIITFYPPASAPGDPPHIRTGNLKRSIERGETKTSGTESVTLISIGKGLNRDYAKFLEFGTRYMAARPFISPAFAAVMARSRNSATIFSKMLFERKRR